MPRRPGNAVVPSLLRRSSRSGCEGRTGLRLAAATLAFIATSVPAAVAFQLPPVAGVGYPNVPIDRGKKVSAFFGYSYGQDSNILRGPSDSEIKDSFQEGLVGLVFVTGTPSRSFDLRYEGKFQIFEKESSHDYQEHLVKTSIVRQTERSSIIGRGAYESRAQATEIEATTGELRKERIFLAPDVGLRIGQTELVIGGSAAMNIYPDGRDQVDPDDDVDSDYLDLGVGAEFRLWRGETTHYLVHFDSGLIDYARDLINREDDYGYQRLYLGVRSERTARSAYEIAGGVQGNTKGFNAFSPAQEEVFASVRCTWLMLGGRAALVAGYTQGGEAALVTDADFKTVGRLTGRISYAANTRLSFTGGVTTEEASFGNYDPATATPTTQGDLKRLAWDVGVIYEIGSPERLHGRAFLSYGSETRDGTQASEDYARTRWFGGVALVY